MPVFNCVTKAISKHTNEVCEMKKVCGFGKYKNGSIVTLENTRITYTVYTDWLFKHTNGDIDLRDITKLLPKAKPEKKHTIIVSPDVHINDVDRFCEILSGITIHNYTAGGTTMS